MTRKEIRKAIEILDRKSNEEKDDDIKQVFNLSSIALDFIEEIYDYLDIDLLTSSKEIDKEMEVYDKRDLLNFMQDVIGDFNNFDSK